MGEVNKHYVLDESCIKEDTPKFSQQELNYLLRKNKFKFVQKLFDITKFIEKQNELINQNTIDIKSLVSRIDDLEKFTETINQGQ